MKKVLYAFVLVGIIAVACNKEQVTGDNNIGTYTYVINATADPGILVDNLTKTTYTSDETFSWSKGDQISVLFHNGDDNRFFTLTAVKGGSASAQFKGEITDGYTIGASDDGKKWALYPADAGHVYNKDAVTDKVKFNIPANQDISATPSVVRIPMEARGDANDNFTFSQLTCCFKYTFTGLTSVSKVKLTVENTGDGYYMSGRSGLRESSGTYYLHMYEDSGSTSVSITTSVVSNTATIYVPARKWLSLRATITLQNMDAGSNYENIIYKASSTGTGLYSIDRGRICQLPSLNVSSYGVGTPFWSKYSINWNSVTASAGGDDPFRTIKAKQDGNYLYLYLDIKKSGLNFSKDYTHYHRMGFYFSNGTGTSSVWNQEYSWFSGFDFTWLVKSQVATMDFFNGLEKIFVDKNVVVNDTKNAVFLELKIDRTATLTPYDDTVVPPTGDKYYSSLNPALSYLSGTSVRVGVVLDDVKVPGWSGSVMGYAPAAGGDMLSVTMTALP